MKSHIVIDGNAFYEVDEECLQRRKREAKRGSGTDDIRRKQQNTRFGRRTPGL